MQTVNIHDAKTQFSKLIEAVSQGERVIIAKAGKPVAELIAIESAPPPRKPGSLKGKIKIADDFDSPLPNEILDAFEGN
ncbi:MAG: type II toxin-antitoxin system Phd/YefM family antitoxin [Pseudomonadota bacterium]|nr:type II toxin-antitoxin system Phd/YefM family antitoxin [Pseudomonadota bacterium]